MTHEINLESRWRDQGAGPSGRREGRCKGPEVDQLRCWRRLLREWGAEKIETDRLQMSGIISHAGAWNKPVGNGKSSESFRYKKT